MARRYPKAIDRFNDMFEPEPNTGCWLWTGATRSKLKYGVIRWDGKQGAAHRFSYEQFKGKIPDGLHIDHLCRMPLCVNPDHLEAVTQRVNNNRGTSPCAQNYRKTHCKNGHELSDENLATIYGKEVGVRRRRCLACRKASAIRSQKKRRARLKCK